MNGRIDRLQAEANRRFDALQAENNRRFETAGARFDQMFDRLDELSTGGATWNPLRVVRGPQLCK